MKDWQLLATCEPITFNKFEINSNLVSLFGVFCNGGFCGEAGGSGARGAVAQRGDGLAAGAAQRLLGLLVRRAARRAPAPRPRSGRVRRDQKSSRAPRGAEKERKKEKEKKQRELFVCLFFKQTQHMLLLFLLLFIVYCFALFVSSCSLSLSFFIFDFSLQALAAEHESEARVARALLQLCWTQGRAQEAVVWGEKISSSLRTPGDNWLLGCAYEAVGARKQVQKQSKFPKIKNHIWRVVFEFVLYRPRAAS